MRIRTRTSIIMLSQAVTQASTVALGVVLVRLISKQTFGAYRQLILIQTFLAGLFSLQLANSLYCFIPKLGPAQRRAILNQTCTLSFFIAALIAAIMFLGAAPIARLCRNPELEPLLRIFCLYPFAERLNILIPPFMISIDRPLRAGLYTGVLALSRFAILIGGFALSYELFPIITTLIAAAAIIAFVGFIDMQRLSWQSEPYRFSPQLLRQQWTFCWPLLATAIVGVINVRFDKLIISSYFGPEIYAVYACGAVEIPVMLITLITTSVSAGITSNLVTQIDAGSTIAAVQLWQQAGRKCSLVILPCFAFMFVNASTFVTLAFGPAYRQVVWPFMIYLCMLPLRTIVYATMFRALGRTRPISIAALIALIVNVFLSVLLVWLGRGGILSFVGPSIATVCSVFVMVAYLLAGLIAITKIPLRNLLCWTALARTMLIAILIAAAVWPISLLGLPLALQLLLQAIIFSIAFTAVAWKTIFTPDDKELIVVPLQRMTRLLGLRHPITEMVTKCPHDC